MLFKKIGFDADKSAQYFSVKEAMASIYCEEENLFGPIFASSLQSNFSESSKEVQIKMKKKLRKEKI